jgi:glycosyltransferase involved in cell wall biosynthesis|tara:strand:+ start:326 stop:1081 length:756 start_codon:yes stop_codon:yes gene_type:complete
MKPKISIITPLFNSSNHLEEMINSVKQQSFKNWELIIIDDCSTDNPVKIIKKFKNKKIRYIRNRKNIGAGLSRNIGTKLARGRYITFIDSDDKWHKDFLSKTFKFIKRKNCEFVFTSYYWMEEKGKIKGKFNVPNVVDYRYILKTNPISCLTRMYDTKFIGKIYSPDLKIRQDYVFCLTILKKIKFAYGLNKPLAYRRLRSNSLSNNKFRSAIYQFYVYYKYEKFNIIKSLFYLINWFILGIIKHIKNYAI